jgi:hypothetical protein
METSNQTQDQQKKTQSIIADCVSIQSHGTVEEYAAMDAIYGTIYPA